MTLINSGHQVATSWTDVYEVPTGQTARITQIQAAGIAADTDSSGVLNLRWQDATNGANYNLIVGLIVPRGTAISCVTGELILETGDKLQAQADDADTVTLTLGAELI